MTRSVGPRRYDTERCNEPTRSFVVDSSSHSQTFWQRFSKYLILLFGFECSAFTYQFHQMRGGIILVQPHHHALAQLLVHVSISIMGTARQLHGR